MKELGLTKKKTKKKEDDCVTKVTGKCPGCNEKTDMEIKELNNTIIARCTQCGYQQIINLDTKKYFEEYRKKGDQR